MSDPIKYKIGSISQLTGFSPELLRAWENRYSLLNPSRGSGGQRIYNEEDVSLLFSIKELLARGHSIGELATWSRQQLVSSGAADRPASQPAKQDQVSTAKVMELGQVFIEEIIQGAINCDQQVISSALQRATALFSPQVLLHHIIRLSTIEIGNLWHKGECPVAGEHMSSALFGQVIALHLGSTPLFAPAGHCRVICSCLPGEGHTLGSQLVAFRLKELGYIPLLMHGGLPFASLDTAVQRTGCHFICLSVTSQDIFTACLDELLDFKKRWQDKCTIVVGGQGVLEHNRAIEAGIHLCSGATPVHRLPASFFSTTFPAGKRPAAL